MPLSHPNHIIVDQVSTSPQYFSVGMKFQHMSPSGTDSDWIQTIPEPRFTPLSSSQYLIKLWLMECRGSLHASLLTGVAHTGLHTHVCTHTHTPQVPCSMDQCGDQQCGSPQGLFLSHQSSRFCPTPYLGPVRLFGLQGLRVSGLLPQRISGHPWTSHSPLRTIAELPERLELVIPGSSVHSGPPAPAGVWVNWDRLCDRPLAFLVTL